MNDEPRQRERLSTGQRIGRFLGGLALVVTGGAAAEYLGFNAYDSASPSGLIVGVLEVIGVAELASAATGHDLLATPPAPNQE